MLEKAKPIINRRIFWDTDFDALDYDNRYKSIIVRVFERGDVEDIRNTRRYYGDEKIIDTLKTTKFLPLHRTHLVSAIFHIPLKDMRCYILRQLNPELLPY
jgi:hypothetical protein